MTLQNPFKRTTAYVTDTTVGDSAFGQLLNSGANRTMQLDARIDFWPKVAVGRIERVVEVEHPSVDIGKTRQGAVQMFCRSDCRQTWRKKLDFRGLLLPLFRANAEKQGWHIPDKKVF